MDARGWSSMIVGCVLLVGFEGLVGSRVRSDGTLVQGRCCGLEMGLMC